MRKSVTRTLRIDQDLDSALSKRATAERLSFSSLAAKCLRRYVEWDVAAPEFGVVASPRLLLNELWRTMSEGDLEGLGRRIARDVVGPGTQYMMGEFNTANAIEVLRRASIYGRNFGFDMMDGRDSRNHVLVLKHDQGMLWSRYYLGILDETFRVLLGQKLKVTVTDDLCVAQLALGGGATT